MKKVFSFSVLILLAILTVYANAHSVEGLVAMAMFAPLLPRDMFGRPKINRAIDLGGGTWGEGGESLYYPVYDRLHMNSALLTQPRSLFATRVGAQRETRTLTYADTNVQKSEGTSSTEKYTFHQLNTYYTAMEPRTDAEIQLIMNFFRETFVRFQIDNKTDMFIIPLWKMFGATQLISAPAVTVNSRFPEAMFMGRWELKIPIVLQSLTTYEMIVTPNVASDAALNNDFIGFEFESRKDRK